MQKQLLIIGGGFAGFWSAISAIRQSRELKKTDELEITLINPDNYMTIRPRLYEVSLEGLRVELGKYFTPLGINLVIGKAEIINPDSNLVVVSTDHGLRHFNYDYLILSSGSMLKGVNLPGIQYSYNVDSYINARKMEDHMIELAQNNFSGHGAATFVIVGAGLTGLEAATTIREKAAALQAIYSSEKVDFKVVLLERADQVAGYYAKAAQDYILEVLVTKDIEMVTNTYLQSVEKDTAVLANGVRIPTQTVIWSAGMVASPLTQFFNGQKDASGRLHVNKFLKLPGYDNVIIAGDVANTPVDDKGNVSVMSCQFSMYLGKWAGHNAINDLFAEPLKPYVNTTYATCLDLGQNDGLFTMGWERNLLHMGRAGKDIKVMINEQLIYPADDVNQTIHDSYPEIPTGL